MNFTIPELQSLIDMNSNQISKQEQSVWELQQVTIGQMGKWKIPQSFYTDIAKHKKYIARLANHQRNLKCVMRDMVGQLREDNAFEVAGKSFAKYSEYPSKTESIYSSNHQFRVPFPTSRDNDPIKFLSAEFHDKVQEEYKKTLGDYIKPKSGADEAIESMQTGMKPTNPKDIIGSDKLPLHLWPNTATAMGCIGMLNGALKYGRSNFRESGVRASIYVDACKRHLDNWFEGEENDSDDNVPHLAAALSCIAIIVDARAAGKLVDDRMVQGGYKKLTQELTKHVKELKLLHKDKNPKHFTIADNK